MRHAMRLGAWLLLLAASPAWAGTCAMCSMTLKEGGSAGLIRGILFSVILIGGIPLFLFVVGYRYLIRHWDDRPGETGRAI